MHSIQSSSNHYSLDEVRSSLLSGRDQQDSFERRDDDEAGHVLRWQVASLLLLAELDMVRRICKGLERAAQGNIGRHRPIPPAGRRAARTRQIRVLLPTENQHNEIREIANTR